VVVAASDFETEPYQYNDTTCGCGNSTSLMNALTGCPQSFGGQGPEMVFQIDPVPYVRYVAARITDGNGPDEDGLYAAAFPGATLYVRRLRDDPSDCANNDLPYLNVCPQVYFRPIHNTVQWRIAANETTWLVVDSDSLLYCGWFSLTIRNVSADAHYMCAMPHTCETPYVISHLPAYLTGTTCGNPFCSLALEEPSCQYPSGYEHVYMITEEALRSSNLYQNLTERMLTISTCGSRFDTILSVRSGFAACDGPDAVELACNDDSPTANCTVHARDNPSIDSSSLLTNVYMNTSAPLWVIVDSKTFGYCDTLVLSIY
jgi:hypothetical protein